MMKIAALLLLLVFVGVIIYLRKRDKPSDKGAMGDSGQ